MFGLKNNPMKESLCQKMTWGVGITRIELDANITYQPPLNVRQGSAAACSQKYYYYQRPSEDQHSLSDSHRRPICLIGDRYAWSETHQRTEHASSETDMLDLRPIGNQNAPSETNIPVESNKNSN